MKRLLLCLPLMLLFGCGTDPRVDQIREATATICGFVPTITTVAAILANPGATSVAQIAQSICNAIALKTPQGLYSINPFTDDCPMVNGVCVEGDFIK